MPFARPSLSDLRTQAAADMSAALPGSDPLLRFSNLNILGTVQAGMAHLGYGYLDWIAQQSVPFTCSAEFLEGWAALKGISRVPAGRATGSATFTGTNGTVLSAGTLVVRGDGVAYRATTSGTVSGGTVTVTVLAEADPAGLLGARGNLTIGTALTLGTSIAGIAAVGVAATAFTGGSDLEVDDSLRARMLQAYQAPAHGGSVSDYVTWALSAPGVSRAWCVPHGYGAGTVLVFVMLDSVQAAFSGFPQGTAGVATGETRDTPATGDQLAVANLILPLQPVTALVYVLGPTANTVAFTISGLATASAGTKAAVGAAITAVFLTYGSVGIGTSTVALSLIESAIAAVPLTTGFVLTTPSVNIVSPAGSLPVLGAITWA